MSDISKYSIIVLSIFTILWFNLSILERRYQEIDIICQEGC